MRLVVGTVPRVRSVAALGAAAVLGLVGCSAEEARPSTVPPLAVGSPSASAGPKAPSATQPSQEIPDETAASTDANVTSIPDEATHPTPEAASAFARYYFETLVNGAYRTLDPALVAAASTEECGSCGNIVKDVRRLKASSLSVAGPRFTLDYAEAAPPEADGSVIVDFRFSSDPYVERNETDSVVREEPAQVGQDAQVKLVRRSNSWAVMAIRTVP